MAKIEKSNEVMMESLSYPDVVMNFNPNQLKDLVQKGDDRKVRLVKGVVDAEIGRLRTSNPALATEVEDVAQTAKKEERNKKLTELTAKDAEAGRLARTKFITSSPAWEI